MNRCAVLTLLAQFALTGCALHAPEGPAGTGPAMLEPLPYYAWVKTASSAEVAAERARLDTAGASVDPLVSSVQRALLLGVSADATPARRQQALALLRNSASLDARQTRHRDYRALADLLSAALTEHAVQPIVAPPAPAVNTDAQAEIEALRASNRQLQDKIDALTSIERQLIERELQTQP